MAEQPRPLDEVRDHVDVEEGRQDFSEEVAPVVRACSFCRISSGEARADLVYRDDDVIAFLPLAMQASAHVLVAPRRHACAIWDLDPGLLGKAAAVAREIAMRMRAVGATGVNLLHASGVDAQQSVPHFHLHVLARRMAWMHGLACRMSR